MKKGLGNLIFICLFFFPREIALSQDVVCRKIREPNPASGLFNGRLRLGENSLILASSYEEMSRATVELLIERMRAIAKEKGEVKIGLPTGNTSEKIYEILRTQFKDDPIWEQVILVQLDEYVGADPDLPESFQYQLRDRLVNHVNPKKFLCINGNAEDIQAERERYAKELAAIGELDILVLGIGQNGHLAFNEPGFETPGLVGVVELTEETKEANGVNFSDALTVSLNTILKAKQILLIASGENKQDIIERALLGEVSLLVPATFLQTHPNTTYIIVQDASSNELRALLKEELKLNLRDLLGEREMKVFVTDFDFTLSPLGSKIRDSVIDKLLRLAKNGIHIAIVTGTRYEGIKERFLDYLPADFPWENLSIYANLGASAYGFDAQGRSIFIYPEVSMLPEQIEILERVIEDFKERFSSDFKDASLLRDVKYTIYLTDRVRSRELYEKYLAFLEERLKGTGLIINGTGHLGTIDITYADKSYALYNLRERLGVEFGEMLYVGDAFSGKFANDLPTMIPGVGIFNVGSIDAIPQGIFSIGIRGDLGTEILLETLGELTESSD